MRASQDGDALITCVPHDAQKAALLPMPFRPMCVKSLYVPLWPESSRWGDMDQTPMPNGLQGLDHVATLTERIELLQSVV